PGITARRPGPTAAPAASCYDGRMAARPGRSLARNRMREKRSAPPTNRERAGEYPFLFYGARSVRFNDGANREYAIRFVRPMSASDHKPCEARLRKALAESGTVDASEVEFLWGRGAWLCVRLYDYFDWSGGYEGIRRASFLDLCDDTAAAFRDLHARFPIGEI